LIDLRNSLRQGIALPQVEPQHEPMVIGQPTMQRIVQLLAARLEPAGRRVRPTCSKVFRRRPSHRVCLAPFEPLRLFRRQNRHS
jgi:hypothetical protein